MDGRIDNGGLTATRFAQKPLHQPNYSFRHVPKPERNLQGSSLQRIDNREPFLTSMAELLLLCKEAMRRRPAHTAAAAATTTAGPCSKPLSLEYLADRLDIDDPLFGYLIRTHENQHRRDRHWQKGMLQGFITVTTFTNWQRTFRWDSSNEAAFECDPPELRQLRLQGVRKWDEHNVLATEMNQTVRYGDIWAEGVVWPRIAEISLLGGLGCGRAMISLVVEELERMKASGKANYDYVVLQATDNSIPFYEAMGFVRVGAVMEDEVQLKKRAKGESGGDDDDDSAYASSSSASSSSSSSSSDVVAEPVPEGSPEKPDVMALPDHVATSPITSYRVPKAGTTLNDVAKKLKVDVWDIVFLNMKIYPELAPSSRLLEGTMLHIPKKVPLAPPTRSHTQPTFYTAKENDTPRMIAKMFNVSCLELVKANKARHEGLVSSSRLKEGTRVKVSHLDQPDIILKPYAHWSFPDDDFEEGEPSYMMALKLNRQRGSAARERPFASTLAVPVTAYEPTSLLLPPSPEPVPLVAKAPPPPPPAAAAASNKKSAKRSREALLLNHPDAPKRPKKPLGAYMLYFMEQREVQRHRIKGMNIGQASKFFSAQWNKMPHVRKSKYLKQAERAMEEHLKAKAVYEQEVEVFFEQNPDLLAEEEASSVDEKEQGVKPFAVQQQQPPSDVDMKSELYNKVVKLKPEALTEGSRYKYWYVLTYIPDLKWCHLAPLEKVGTFGPEKPKVAGRPKWMLVDESLGKEVDISSRFCIPIKARFMRKTLDADKEEWDVIDDGTDPTERRQSISRSSTRDEYDSDRHPNVVRKNRPGSLIKPSVTRKRQSSGTMPPLFASFPGSSEIITVKLRGARLYDPTFDNPVKRGRGRPRGSKSKPKSETESNDSLSRLEGGPVEPPKKRRGRPPGTGKNQIKLVSSAPLPDPGTPKQRGRPPGTGKNQKKLASVAPRDAGTPKRIGRPPGSGKKKKESPGAGTPKRRGRPPGSGMKKKLQETPSDLAAGKRKRGRPRGSGKVRNGTVIGAGQNGRPRRSAAPSFLGEGQTPNLSPSSSSDESMEPSRKKRKTSSQAERGSSRPRRSAAPSFLGEAPDPVLSDESDKIPYQPRKSTKLDSPRPTSKRWHPVRETRNGKNTPRARRQEDMEESRPALVPSSSSRQATRSTPRQEDVQPKRGPSSARRADNGRPKRKAAPTFTLDDTPRKRRSLRL